MALSEFETKRCEKLAAEFVERHRPPPELRHQVDLGYSVAGQSVEIHELRPRPDDDAQKIRSPMAKATYEKTSRQWKVYWQKRDLKWHSYAPRPVVDSLEEFFELVEEDPHACFFG